MEQKTGTCDTCHGSGVAVSFTRGAEPSPESHACHCVSSSVSGTADMPELIAMRIANARDAMTHNPNSLEEQTIVFLADRLSAVEIANGTLTGEVEQRNRAYVGLNQIHGESRVECDNLRSQLTAALARAEKLQKQVDHMKAAGCQLSNIAYNLAQQEVALTSERRHVLKRCQEDWDTAVSTAALAPLSGGKR